MTDKPKHTPTPWSVHRNGNHICIDGDACVAELNPLNQKATREADAAFIVLAVNAHQTLVESLRGIHTELESAAIDWDANPTLALARRNVFRAIAKADGRNP